MRSVTSEKEQRKKGASKWLFIVIALALVLGAFIVCARMGVVNVPGLTPVSDPGNFAQVAVLNSAAAQGAPVSGLVSYRAVDMDAMAESGDMLPDDVIMKGDPLGDKVLRVALMPNTILTESMLAEKEENYKMDATARYRDIDFISLNSSLKVGDVVDVHYTEYELDSGKGNLIRNDIVVAKKEVVDLNGKIVTLELAADEQTLLQAAAVEMNAINNTTKSTGRIAELTLTTYKQPTLQKPAIVTYVNQDANRINGSDPNQRPADPVVSSDLPGAN